MSQNVKNRIEWIDYSKKQDGSYRVGVMLGSVDNDEKINIIVPPPILLGVT